MRLRPILLGVVVAISTAAAEEVGMPLDEGVRWRYQMGDRESIRVDVAGTRAIGEVETIVLEVHGASFFWSQHELFVTETDGDLAVHATSDSTSVFMVNPPWLLVDAPLTEGKTWESLSRNEASLSEFGFAARVVGREEVVVPAGAFQAWKIEYVLTRHMGTEQDLRAWFVPGTGFVRIEKWRSSTLGHKEAMADPIVHQLAAFETGEWTAPVDPPLGDADRARAEAWIAELGSEDFARREEATDALAAMGRTIVPFLEDALAKAIDPEVAGRIRHILGLFPDLEILARAISDRISTGDPLAISIEFRIVNRTSRMIPVLPSLDASDVGWRYPKYTIEIRYGDPGEAIEPPGPARCGNVNALAARDFSLLRPTEEFDPFGPGSFGHRLLQWKPDKPGVYRIRLVYDVSAESAVEWRTFDGAPDPEAERLLAELPRGRFESNEVTVVVEE